MAATILFATGFECGRAGGCAGASYAVVWDDVVSGGRTGSYCARLSVDGGVTAYIPPLSDAYSFAFSKAEGVNLRIVLFLPIGTPPDDSLELRFTSSTVTLYIDDVAVESASFTCSYDYVPVQVYITDSYTGVKVNHVLVLEYAGGLRHDYLHEATFSASSGNAYLDDVAIGYGGFLGQISVEPVAYTTAVPESYAVQQFGTGTDVLRDGDLNTGYKLRFHVNVNIDDTATLAEHFAPGGPIYTAFGGPPPQYGIFVVNQDGYDTQDNALAAAKGGTVARGDAFTIINNNPASPAIEYSEKYAELNASISPVQNALTVGYTISVTASTLDDGVGRAISITSAQLGSLSITGYNSDVTTLCAFTSARLDGGALSVWLKENM